MKNKFLFLTLVFITSCASSKSFGPENSDIPIINKVSYEARSAKCFQATNGANKPRVRGDEMSPIVEHYDYFDCMDSVVLDNAIDDINKDKKRFILDEEKLYDQIELNSDIEFEEFNCELNLASISSNTSIETKYYNCKKEIE
tara:strand:+ start:734 stop:1162 length:429 start_codon:yes stop_codon:yes gene_type:complete